MAGLGVTAKDIVLGFRILRLDLFEMIQGGAPNRAQLLAGFRVAEAETPAGKINIAPLQRENLHAPASCQYQELDGRKGCGSRRPQLLVSLKLLAFRLQHGLSNRRHQVEGERRWKRLRPADPDFLGSCRANFWSSFPANTA